MNSRKNHPAASRTSLPSFDRSCFRRLTMLSANPSAMTSRRAALYSRFHSAG
jgi:hypothetical protein